MENIQTGQHATGIRCSGYFFRGWRWLFQLRQRMLWGRAGAGMLGRHMGGAREHQRCFGVWRLCLCYIMLQQAWMGSCRATVWEPWGPCGLAPPPSAMEPTTLLSTGLSQFWGQKHKTHSRKDPNCFTQQGCCVPMADDEAPAHSMVFLCHGHHLLPVPWTSSAPRAMDITCSLCPSPAGPALDQ